MNFMIGNDVENLPPPAVEETDGTPVSEISLESDRSQRGKRLAGIARDLFETLLLALLMFAAINGVTARIRVEGVSMRPTLESGSYVLVNRLAYRLGTPSRSEVIVFHFPGNPDEEYIKRIIGLPGDRVEVSRSEVRINGQLLEEPYIKEAPEYESGLRVPQGNLYVLGDNRNNSSDSHQWGTVPLENVVGKALLVYWPPQEWQIISHSQASQP